MITLDLRPLEGALNDFLGNYRGSYKYDFEFTDIVKKNVDIQAFDRNTQSQTGTSFRTSGFGPIDTNILNFVNILRLDNDSDLFVPNTILNNSSFSYSTITTIQQQFTQNDFKIINTEIPNITLRNIFNLYYSESFTEESLRTLKPHIIPHLVHRFLDNLNAYSLLFPALVSSNIYAPYHVNLNATNIKDVMHYIESYLHQHLVDENDRLVFLLETIDYQRLVRLKDSTGNYLFCSNCVWNNIIDLGKSVIVNFIRPNYQYSFFGGFFYVFIKSKAYLLTFSPLTLRIARNPSNNTYHFELSMRCLFYYPPISTIPYSFFLLASNLLAVDWNNLIGNV